MAKKAASMSGLALLVLFGASEVSASDVTCYDSSSRAPNDTCDTGGDRATLLLQHGSLVTHSDALSVEEGASGLCPYHANSGADCGFDGITQQQCEARGCCWDEASPSMWCYPRGPVSGDEQAGTHNAAATRFLSWNVYYANNLRGRAGQIADGIKEVDPEIVSLQEMWHEWDAILYELNQRMPGAWSFARGGETEKVWDGDILFRSDLWTLEESGVRAYGDRGVSWAALKRKSDGAGIIAAGTHPWCCTNGEPILRTVQDEIHTLVKQLRATRPGYPAAVMGDFNAGYYNHASYLMRDGHRSGFNREWNILPYTFKDSYDIDDHKPDESTGHGVKIDFVYFEQTPLQMGQVVSSKIWGSCNKAGSDHCGVSGDIILSTGRANPGGTAAPSTTTSPPATSHAESLSCASFADWPNVDNGVTCGGCTALVRTAPHDGRCDKFCSSFGHVCVRAAEEQNENCEVKYPSPCDQAITSTSDMLCTCELRTNPEGTAAWVHHEGLNCYHGMGGSGIPNKSPMALDFYLDGCKEACEAEAQCVAIVMVRDRKPYKCYLLQEVRRSSCATNTAYDLWQVVPATQR